MKKLVFFLAAFIISATSSTAMAKNVWRECGIGGMIFSNTGWAAIISNIIWDLGTTATSSNVSSDDLCEGKSASTAKFIHETYANIEEETALGKGAHLTAMLNIMGCDQASHNQIINKLRGDIQQKMSTPNYSQKTKIKKAEGYYDTLMHNIDTQFAQECHVI